MHLFHVVLDSEQDEARFEAAVASFLDRRGLTPTDAPLAVPSGVDGSRIERSVLFWSSEAVAEFERYWIELDRRHAVAATLSAVLSTGKPSL